MDKTLLLKLASLNFLTPFKRGEPFVKNHWLSLET